MYDISSLRVKLHYVNQHVELDVFEDIYNK